MASVSTPRLDETFDLLTHPHRRYILYYLTRESERVEIETLATAIAAWDGGPTGTDRRTDPNDVEIALHHMHLPKLADAGIITFDANTGCIELRELNGHGPVLDEAARIEGYNQTTAAD